MRAFLSRALEHAWYGGGRLSLLLIPVAWLYRVLLAFAKLRGRLRARTMPIPVVVVGNVTVGGTGKTPMVVWLVQQLQAAGFNPAVITRGYLGSVSERSDSSGPLLVSAEASAAKFGDEAVLLARQLPRCPVVAGADRAANVAFVLRQTSADVVVSDDGLQHFALLPTCAIAVVDGQRGLGNGRLLPAGPLREPATRLDAVDTVLVNGGHWTWPGAVRFELQCIQVTQLVDGERRSLEDFKGARVHALAAIGNPQRFFSMLRTAGCDVDAHAWPDHAAIPAQAMQFNDGAPVLITAKDAVKCPQPLPRGVWMVDVEVRIDAQARSEVMRTILASIGRAAQSQ